MKKSDMTVSMPMSTFEELSAYRQKYILLLADMRKCFDFHYADEGRVQFDVDKALLLCKSQIPVKYADCDIEKVEI